MALSDYDEPRQKVAAIQRDLDQTIESIRNNKSYSATGRLAEMSRATLQARKAAAALKDKFKGDRDSRRESLERSLFGHASPSPAEMMVLRDSRDRAAALESAEDAQLKLKLAQQSGDAFLVKAIAQVAVARGWGGVVDAYAGDSSYTRQRLDELAAIPSGRGTDTADGMVFRIRAPRELFGTDADLERFKENAQ